MAPNITGDSKPEKQKLSIGNIASSFKQMGANFSQKFSKGPGITFGKGGTGTSSPLTSGTDPSKITDSLNETNRILVEIQKQLSIDFANRIAESSEQLKANKRAVNTQKRAVKENKLESKWLGATGKALQNVDKSLGNVVGIKAGGLFGTLLKGLGLLFTGGAILVAVKFFQNPDNIKRLKHFFNNIGEYATKAIDWVKTSWREFKPKLDLLQNLPFNNMLEAELWIQSAVYRMFPEWVQKWMNDPLLQYKKTIETYRRIGGEKGFDPNKHRFTKDKEGNYIREDGPSQQWIRDEIGYKKGGYTGGGGGRVHANEFVMNSDAVNKWGTNLLSAMNEGKDQSLGLGKTPRRTVISYEDLPIIRQPKTNNNKRTSNAPATSVPTISPINPFNPDYKETPLLFGFAEFV